MLTRDAILSAEDLRTKVVDVPEWGGQVTVREMTGTERDEYEASVLDVRGSKLEINSKDVRAKMVAMCAVDENGDRLFTLKDVEVLGRKSARALDRLVDAIASLSELDTDLEVLGKGLPEIHSGG